MVTIELDQEDDPQIIFETLNARGEPLTPSDLVRNFVFLTATREGADVAGLYDRYWRAFDEPVDHPFWKQVERQGRLKRSRLDLFFFHYVTFRTGDEIKEGHLYQAFREWWDSQSSRAVTDELASLVRYAKIYRALLDPDTSSRFGRFAHRLRVLDTTVVYPTILWAAGELGVESSELHGMMEDIESYFIRRAVCGYGSKSYSRLFLEWFSKLRQSQTAPSRAALRSMLTSSQADSAVWPADDEFRRHLVADPLYLTLKPRRTQMLLEALNHALRPKHSEDIEIKSALTVEHVLPQGADALNWPFSEPSGGETIDVRWRLTHSLGNLTLLTQPLNSSVSNGPFVAKRPAITTQSLLTLNSYFQGQSEWNEATILERGSVLAAAATQLWPRP